MISSVRLDQRPGMSYGRPAHSQLLTVAAKNVLRPMGMSQKRRSRIWPDDHGWWLCVVEFQPSGWSRGSYLNVGCMWLWNVKDYISFDEGCRVEEFRAFLSETQFEAFARSLAERAVNEVVRYRKLFPTIVCSHYDGQWRSGLWPTFHSGVTCGLSGKPEDAQQRFQQLIDSTGDGRPWALNMQAEARRLRDIACDTAQFRDVVTSMIHRARELQKLPPVPLLSFD